MYTSSPVYLKGEKFLREKLGYSQKEIDEFNKFDSYQIIKLYNVFKGINRNIKNTCRCDNYDAFEI
jgi:hypothetical protein